MAIIDGKHVSDLIRDELKDEIAKINEQGDIIRLAVIIVGKDPASEIYVRNKIKACEYVGIESLCYTFPENVSEEEILSLIDKLNNDESVYGILVQLPLPNHLNKEKILNKINVYKDVDGFSAYQAGRLFLGENALVSCTPKGIIELLHRYNIDLVGKNAVVIGRSNIVGKPTAMLLMQNNATVTVCHSRTTNLAEYTKKADVIVLAVGKPQFLTSDMIKDGVVVIDAGINRVNGKLCGDSDFEAIKDKCSFITPVPGGVGPMTVTMLLKNTLQSYYSTHNARN